MNDKHRKEGSIWTRWDLHLHTPGTKLASSFGEPTDGVWSAYLEALEKSDVQVFGITDYFSYANYFVLVEKYRTAYPNGTKVFFPTSNSDLPKQSVGPERMSIRMSFSIMIFPSVRRKN